jgi:hypothetical protein
MSVFSVGLRPLNIQAQAPPQGELVAATPLGRDADGKNLVAYIVRTEDDAPAVDIPRRALANNNNPAEKFQTNSQQAQKQTRQESAARFIRPDPLLSRMEQAQVDQLRARDDDVTNDDANAPLESYVYQSGPDGRRYAVGAAAALLAQKIGQDTAPSKAPPSSPEAQKALQDARLYATSAYRQMAGYDAQGPRASLIDQAF